MAKLGDVCSIISGSTPNTNMPEYWDGDIKWITPAELNEDSFYVMDSVRHITEQGKNKAGLTYMPAGTVILSSRAPIGKTAIAGCEMCCNQGFKNLICSDSVYNEYLYFFLKGKTDYLNSLGRGATFKELSKSIVENIDIPLPNYETQKQIAHQFRKIELVIKLRKQQLSKLDELVKSRFVELFGDFIETENPVDFESICEFVTVGIANSATHAFCDDGVIMFRNQNIKEDYLDTSDIVHITSEFASKYKTKMLKKDDLLIVRTGYPGVACLVPEQYEGCQTFTTLIARLKDTDTINPRFVCHYINSEYGKKYVKDNSAGAAQQNFGATALSKLPICIPPIELQNEYISFIEQTDKSKLKIQKSLEKLETLKKALMQKYFG